MRLDLVVGLVALAVLAEAAPARAETVHLVCRGLVTDTTSHEQTKRAAPFELAIDLDGKTVLYNGKPAVAPAISDEKITFNPPGSPPPKGRIRSVVAKGAATLQGPPGAFEIDRRTGFWRNRGASGPCHQADASLNLF